MPNSVILRRRPLPSSQETTESADSLITARRPLSADTAPAVDEDVFRQWYTEKAKRYDLPENPDDPSQFYDYRSAFKAGASPDASGHWPSQFKKPGHPNEIVGGFNTRTGERVPGTPRAGERELVAQGWEPAAAKRLAQTPEPGQKRSMASLDPWASTLENMVAGQDREDAALRNVGGDLAVTSVKGAISVPEAAVGLADIATMGAAGKLAQQAGFEPKEARRILDTWYSDRYKKAKQDVADATGVLATAVKAMQNPDVILHSIVESIPLMLAGGAVGRAVGPAVGLGAEASGALGEALASAGSSAEQTRQETPDGMLTLEQTALAATTGAATGVISRLGGFIAGKLGIEDVDTLVAGAAADPKARKNLVRAVVEGAFSEGILEELPQSIVEQVLQNKATGRPLWKGVDQSAVLGAITGGVMGAGAQFMPSRGVAGERPPAPTPESPEPPAAVPPTAPPPDPTMQAAPPPPPPAASPAPPTAPPDMGEVLGGTSEPVAAGSDAAGPGPDVEALLAEADQLDAQADAPSTEPTIEVLDPEGTTENASGESAASAEALSRQEGMKARGETFVVYDRAGNRRVLIGPEAVDYEAKKGETYGIETPEGFRLLDDRGGKVPAGSSPAVLTDEDRAVLESMGQDQAAENAEAIDITPKAEPDPTTMSVEEAQMRASGDPRGAELIDLKAKFGRMKAQASAAMRAMAQAKFDKGTLANKIASLTKAAERASEFFSNTYKSQRGDGFELKLGDTAYGKRDEANAALIERLRAFGDKYNGADDIASEDIGVIGGVTVSAEWVPPPRWSNATNGTVKLTLVAYAAGEQDDVAVASELEPGPELAAGRNIVQTLVNRYEDLAGNSQRLTATIATEQAALKRAEDLLANPPAVIARAEAAQERITALEKELKAESEAKEKAAAAGAQEAVNAMRARSMPAPSGDASVSLTPLATRPGVAANLGITPATQMGITTAHPAQVPEIVAFIDQVGGKTAILKKLRSLWARGFHSEGKITLLAALFEAGNRIELARVLAHEVGHLVDWLSDGGMKRGNLLGRLRSLHGFLKHRYTAVDGTTIKAKEVRDELTALSKAWREWPDDAPAAYHAYRRRGRELYADAISALLNDPDVVQQHAPTFFREFFNELDEKPEVKAAYVELMDVLSGTPDELIERRRGRVRAMFDAGNTRALDLAKLKILEREAQGRSLWQRLRIQHVDRNTALLDRIADYEKEHGALAPSNNPKYLLEEQVHIGATARAFADKYFEPIYAALNKADVDWNTFGEVLFYDRIAAGDRSEVANPQGLSPTDVTAMREKALAELSRAQREVVEQAANDFRAALREVAERAYNAGLYTDEMYAQMKENPAYVTFRVIEYLDKNVTSTVYRQVGTLKDIQHVAESSILKAIVTLKAAEHNNVKRGVFQWFDDNLPGEFATAPSRWNGRGHEPAPSKDRNLKLITYKVKGKTVGKYVDPWVALSFETLGPTELNAALQGLNFLTSKWLRPVFTTMNPGFMTFNAMRDFLRTWKNMPGMSLRKVVQRYAQGAPLAVARAFPLKPGQQAAQWRHDAQRALADAEDAKILDLTLADVFGKDNLEGTNIDQIFADIGVSSYAAQKGRLKRAAGWIEALGDFIETLPKAAALVEMTGGDLSKIGTLNPEQRSVIRAKVGSPDFLQMGSQSRQLSNVLFLFSNAIIQGTRQDVEVATNPTTRGGWWFKTALVNVAPKLAIAAVILAALKAKSDDDDKDDPLQRLARILSGVSEYDLANYTIVPLGLTDEGESVYLRLPQDDTGRFVGALAWKALGLARGDKDALNTMLQAFDVTAGQMPGVNPLLRAPGDLAAFASGNNVYDPFRSRMLFTPDELAARDEHTLKKFVGYEFQQLGGSIVWRFVPGEQRPESKGTLRKVVEFPIASNIIGRWLRVGNRGRVEKLMEGTGAVKQEEARTRLDEKDEVNAAIRTLMDTPPPDRKRVTTAHVDAIMKSVYPSLTGETADRKRQALTRKLGFGVLRSGPDEYVDSLLSATSNAQKAEVVRRAKQDMTPPAFSSWLKKARAEGVVSEAVAKAAGKDR